MKPQSQEKALSKLIFLVVATGERIGYTDVKAMIAINPFVLFRGGLAIDKPLGIIIHDPKTGEVMDYAIVCGDDEGGPHVHIISDITHRVDMFDLLTEKAARPVYSEEIHKQMVNVFMDKYPDQAAIVNEHRMMQQAQSIEATLRDIIFGRK